MTIDPKVLEELEQLEKAATPGPWFTKPRPKDSDGWAVSVAVAFVARGQGVYAQPPGGSYPAADQEFIASVRNAALALIASARAAEQMRAVVEAAKVIDELEGWQPFHKMSDALAKLRAALAALKETP